MVNVHVDVLTDIADLIYCCDHLLISLLIEDQIYCCVTSFHVVLIPGWLSLCAARNTVCESLCNMDGGFIKLFFKR